MNEEITRFCDHRKRNTSVIICDPDIPYQLYINFTCQIPLFEWFSVQMFHNLKRATCKQQNENREQILRFNFN
jgi:hypothetical protein